MSVPPYLDIVKELEAFEKGEIVKSRPYSDGLQWYLFDIASNLLKLGYAKELKELLVTQEKYAEYYEHINGTSGYWFAGNENGNFIFSPTWAERFDQENLLEREQELKPWGAFEALLQFKCAYDAVTENMSFWKILENKTTYDDMFNADDRHDIGLMAEDLRHLMKQTRPDSPRKFKLGVGPELDRLDIVSFKTTLQTVHNILIQILESRQPEQRLDFDSTQSKLFFADTEITISKQAESDAHELLRTMFTDRSKLWDNDEILEDWKVSYDKRRVAKNKVYQAGKAVNRIVAQDTKIKDFLTITTKNVAIHKKYLEN